MFAVYVVLDSSPASIQILALICIFFFSRMENITLQQQVIGYRDRAGKEGSHTGDRNVHKEGDDTGKVLSKGHCLVEVDEESLRNKPVSNEADSPKMCGSEFSVGDSTAIYPVTVMVS